MPLAREQGAGEAQATTNTILLVEDDPPIGAFLEQAIEQETPYRAIVASDGHAALQLVRHFTPCLFILDYGLPDMNGLELYDRLQSNQALAPLPAILITAKHQLPQQQLQQRQLIVFRKPFDLDRILATIETLLTST